MPLSAAQLMRSGCPTAATTAMPAAPMRNTPSMRDRSMHTPAASTPSMRERSVRGSATLACGYSTRATAAGAAWIYRDRASGMCCGGGEMAAAAAAAGAAGASRRDGNVPGVRATRRKVTAQATSRCGASTLVKICGVTNATDAAAAADAGADFVGMIMWPKAKRGVSDAAAAEIAAVATARGATPVGVFVDESADTINGRCAAAGIPVAQLHGDGARASLPGLRSDLRVVWVLNCQPDGTPATALPDVAGRQPDWVLLDGMQGGSGQALDWTRLSPPPAREGWLLAGGLKPDNVAAAVAAARPYAVDVSSGVCGPDGLKKDLEKVAAFVEGVKQAATA